MKNKEEEKTLHYDTASFFMEGLNLSKQSIFRFQMTKYISPFLGITLKTLSFLKNAFSRFFNILVNSYLKVNSIINKSVSETKNVRMEYESKENLIKSRGDLKFNDKEEKLSINFMRDFYAHRLKRKTTKKLVELIDGFSGIDPKIINRIEDGYLKESIEFSAVYSIDHDGMAHFHNLPISTVYDVFDRACESGRSGIMGFLGRLFKTCERRFKTCL